MRNFRWSIISLALLGSTSCALFPESLTSSDPIGVPRSRGEVESGYTYVPIDPFPVASVDGDSCKPADTPNAEKPVQRPLLDALPDNAVRMLVEKFDLKGGVTYGTSKAGAKGETFRVTVDYINADTINVPVMIDRLATDANGNLISLDPFSSTDSSNSSAAERYIVRRVPDEVVEGAASSSGPIFNIPVYVGVGLRVSANVTVVGGSANISGIGVIGYEAEAERLRGSLVVQTLGVNGKAIAAALPIQSELNRTTAQNAIVAVGSIKSLLYSPETITSPRVVGLYLPFPANKALVNALISELSKDRPEWPRPCWIPPKQPSTTTS